MLSNVRFQVPFNVAMQNRYNSYYTYLDLMRNNEFTCNKYNAVV